MEILKSARSLVHFINSIQEMDLVHKQEHSAYDHIGGLFIDVILQAGLNYNHVVKPRVQRIIEHYPESYTVSSLSATIEEYGIEEVMYWNHAVKVDRFRRLIEFCQTQQIDTCQDLYNFLQSENNRKLFVDVKGVGPKTLDYTMKLLGFDTIAVDRHIVGFVEAAGIVHHGYNATKQTVEYAADLMNVSRSSLDASIWLFMSKMENARRGQLAMSL